MTDETMAQPGTETAASQAVAPAAIETAADAGTLIGGDASAETIEASAPADWPADWRQKLAGEDKKTLERLGRMASPDRPVQILSRAGAKGLGGRTEEGLPESAAVRM